MATFKFVPNKLHVSLLRLMSADVQLSSSNRSLKEHSDKQRKRGLDSLGLLCSTLPVNAPQSSKDRGLLGEGGGGCCREENSWKHNIKSFNKGKRAGKGNTA